MKHTIVESSNIYSIGYDPQTVTMEITFRKRGENRGIGATYQYNPITPEGYSAFMNAPSKGKFFSENIRENPLIGTKRIG